MNSNHKILFLIVLIFIFINVSYGEVVHLRSSSRLLSTNEWRNAVERYNFYHRDYNPDQNFNNNFEKQNYEGKKVVLDHSTKN